jgi:hypothetical protein
MVKVDVAVGGCLKCLSRAAILFHVRAFNYHHILSAAHSCPCFQEVVLLLLVLKPKLSFSHFASHGFRKRPSSGKRFVASRTLFRV